MKTFPSTRGAAIALLLGCLATSALRAELSNPAPNLEVNFKDPDSFTDEKLGSGADMYRNTVFAAIRTYLSVQAGQMLPAGYHLKVDFTDIDLGNRRSRKFSSAAGGEPALEFSYSVTDESGTVIRHGSEKLRFFAGLAKFRDTAGKDDLSTQVIQEEKPMLKVWAVATLGRLKESRPRREPHNDLIQESSSIG